MAKKKKAKKKVAMKKISETKRAYKSNYLNQVIARLDFSSTLKELSEGVPNLLAKEILKHFTISQSAEVVSSEIKATIDSIAKKDIRFKQRIYHDRKNEKRLTLEPRAMVIEQLHYKNFRDLTESFLPIVEKLFQKYEDLTVTRFGLRYINVIDIDEKDPLSWDKYINKDLIADLSFEGIKEKKYLTRVFKNIELNYDDIQLRFQYGIHNPDHPAQIKKKQFILDFDAYSQGAHDKAQIIANISKFHDLIEELFEKSITENLRVKMNAGE